MTDDIDVDLCTMEYLPILEAGDTVKYCLTALPITLIKKKLRFKV